MSEASGFSLSSALVVPTLNAEHEIDKLISTVLSQDLSLDEILVIDSSSGDSTTKIVREYSRQHHKIRLIEIPRLKFNHGATRDMALRSTKADFIFFLTQDALPIGNGCFTNLITPLLKDSRIAMAYGRQIPRKDARRFEALVREINYPTVSSVNSLADVNRLGIKTYFASDVCSVYRRSAYEDVGGFGICETNEDMLIAAKFINSGYSVAYSANAEVLHSHNLSFREQYRRNWNVGVFLETHKEIFSCGDELSEGSKLFLDIERQLIKERNFMEAFFFIWDSTARLLGNRNGRNYLRRLNLPG